MTIRERFDSRPCGLFLKLLFMGIRLLSQRILQDKQGLCNHKALELRPGMSYRHGKKKC